MLTVKYSNLFKRDYKLMKKRGLNMQLLHEVVEMLANNKPLPEKYREHFLSGNLSATLGFENYFPCKITY